MAVMFPVRKGSQKIGCRTGGERRRVRMLETQWEEEEITEKGRQPLWEISQSALFLELSPRLSYIFVSYSAFILHLHPRLEPVSKAERPITEFRCAYTAHWHNLRSCLSKVAYIYWSLVNLGGGGWREQTERHDNSTATTYVVFQGDAAAGYYSARRIPVTPKWQSPKVPPYPAALFHAAGKGRLWIRPQTFLHFYKFDVGEAT